MALPRNPASLFKFDRSRISRSMSSTHIQHQAWHVRCRMSTMGKAPRQQPQSLYQNETLLSQASDQPTPAWPDQLSPTTELMQSGDDADNAWHRCQMEIDTRKPNYTIPRPPLMIRSRSLNKISAGSDSQDGHHSSDSKLTLPA